MDTPNRRFSGLYRSFCLSSFWVYQKVFVMTSDAAGRVCTCNFNYRDITSWWFLLLLLFVFTWNMFTVWVCVS